jgi:hypothetical protein
MTQEKEFDPSSLIDKQGRLIVPTDDGGWAKIEALSPEKQSQYQALAEAYVAFDEAEAVLKKARDLIPIAISNLGAAELQLQRTVKGVSPLSAFRAQQAADARERGIAPPKGAEKAALVSADDQAKQIEAQRHVSNAREGLRIARADEDKAHQAVKAARNKRAAALTSWLGLLTPLAAAQNYIKSSVAERAAAKGQPSNTTPRQQPSVLDAHLSFGVGGQPGIRSTRQGQRGAFPAHLRGRSLAPRQ